jgi:hypothetical protein
MNMDNIGTIWWGDTNLKKIRKWNYPLSAHHRNPNLVPLVKSNAMERSLGQVLAPRSINSVNSSARSHLYLSHSLHLVKSSTPKSQSTNSGTSKTPCVPGTSHRAARSNSTLQGRSNHSDSWFFASSKRVVWSVVVGRAHGGSTRWRRIGVEGHRDRDGGSGLDSRGVA